MNTPVRMLTGTAAREDHTTSTTFTELIPTPGEVFTTTQTATLTALFVAECKVSAKPNRLEVRIKIDSAVAEPREVTMTANNEYETHSHWVLRQIFPQAVTRLPWNGESQVERALSGIGRLQFGNFTKS